MELRTGRPTAMATGAGGPETATGSFAKPGRAAHPSATTRPPINHLDILRSPCPRDEGFAGCLGHGAPILEERPGGQRGRKSGGPSHACFSFRPARSEQNTDSAVPRQVAREVRKKQAVQPAKFAPF